MVIRVIRPAQNVPKERAPLLGCASVTRATAGPFATWPAQQLSLAQFAQGTVNAIHSVYVCASMHPEWGTTQAVRAIGALWSFNQTLAPLCAPWSMD